MKILLIQALITFSVFLYTAFIKKNVLPFYKIIFSL